MNIRGKALKWFKSFLVGRTQRVLINSDLSEPLELSFGVPQGSVLGPVLFNIYTSSWSDVFSDSGFNCLGYADDNIGYQVFTVSSQHEVRNISIPTCIDLIKQWMAKFFLKINESKPKIMVIGSTTFHASFNSSAITTFSGESIQFKDTVKHLGVHLDKYLTFKTHINKITSHCYILLRNIKSIRKFLNQAQTESLVHAVLSSRLDYCNSLLFGLPQSSLQKFKRIQASASKIILRRGRRHGLPSEVRLQELHWLPIERRIVFRTLTIVFKCFNGNGSTELSCLLVPYVSDVMNSARNVTFDTRFYYPRTSFGRRAFSFCGPRLWHSLPLDLRLCQDEAIFKGRLKPSYGNILIHS